MSRTPQGLSEADVRGQRAYGGSPGGGSEAAREKRMLGLRDHRPRG